MKINKFGLYFFTALTAATLTAGGLYTYLHFSLHNAYKNNDYHNLLSLAKKYQYVLPDTYKLVLKYVLEQHITTHLASNQKLNLVPIHINNLPSLDNYISKNQLENSDEKWIMFYKELEKHAGIEEPLEELDDLNTNEPPAGQAPGYS